LTGVVVSVAAVNSSFLRLPFRLLPNNKLQFTYNVIKLRYFKRGENESAKDKKTVMHKKGTRTRKKK